MTNTMPKNYAETILNDKNLTSDEKIQRINFVYNNYQEKLDEDLKNFLLKKWAGAALEIGSTAIPFGGAGKLGATAGQKLLQKAIGRKLSQEIGSGAASGLASGAVFGAGRGLIEDKNPLITGLQDAGFGIILGTLGGNIAGRAERFVRGQSLKNYGDIDLLPKDIRKQYTQDVKDFYKDYIQEIILDRNGSINFSKRGVQEQLRWNPKQGQNYPELIKDIKNAKRLPNVPNLKPHQKALVNHYELYQGKNGIHHVEVLKDGHKRYYITKDTFNGTPQATSPGSKEDILKDIHKNDSHATSMDALVTPYNIINDISENINPAPMIIPP